MLVLRAFILVHAARQAAATAPSEGPVVNKIVNAENTYTLRRRDSCGQRTTEVSNLRTQYCNFRTIALCFAARNLFEANSIKMDR